MLRPLSDHILLERKNAPDKSAGGIILPDVAKENPLEGKVIAVGPGRYDDTGRHIEMSVKPGDVVLFTQYGAREVEIDGAKLTILREIDLLAVIET